MKHIRDLLKKQRDGYEIEGWEMLDFIRGINSEEVSETQLAAYLMGVQLRGMTGKELVSMTAGVSDSGSMLKWDGVAMPVVEKYSSGGVGDFTSLVLAPILSACGVCFPIYSIRGLGYLGGALDKLSAIPGYSVEPNIEEFQKRVIKVGCGIASASTEIAPVDGKIFKVADEVGCAQSEHIMAVSIVAKKLATGAKNIVYDLKVGTSTFLPTIEKAKSLGSKLVGISKALGLNSSVVISDMNQPLAYNMGSALELRETVDYLSNVRKNSRFDEVVFAIGAQLLVHAGVSPSTIEAEGLIKQKLENGEALYKFSEMVKAFGGPADFVEKYGEYLPAAPIIRPVFPNKASYIHGYNTREFGQILTILGGGRKDYEDEINYSVGVSDVAPISAEVDHSKPIAVIHAQTEADFAEAEEQLKKSVNTNPASVASSKAVLDILK